MSRIEELASKIKCWECDAGESFEDYFMDWHIDIRTWATWLIEEGFERGSEILAVVKAKPYSIKLCDLDFVYGIHNEGSEDYYDSDSERDKDINLWAKFLIEHPIYSVDLEEFWD
jgi:hypothetical protein